MLYDYIGALALVTAAIEQTFADMHSNRYCGDKDPKVGIPLHRARHCAEPLAVALEDYVNEVGDVDVDEIAMEFLRLINDGG
jgi:hypothetical protein